MATISEDSWDSKSDIFKRNARLICTNVFKQDFDKEYAHSFTKFAEAYTDALYFYNFGFRNVDETSIISGQGAYPYYISSLHVNRGMVALEHIQALAIRIIAKTNIDKCTELGISEAEAFFPLVWPLSLASDVDTHWVNILMSHPSVAESVQQLLPQVRSKPKNFYKPPSQETLLPQLVSIGKCLSDSRSRQQVISLEHLSSHLLSKSSSSSAADSRAEAVSRTMLEDEMLFYMAMMTGDTHLHRDTYDLLRLAFRDYIRSVLDKVFYLGVKLPRFALQCCGEGKSDVSDDKAVILASTIQSVLPEQLLGFGAFTRVQGCFNAYLASLTEKISRMLLDVSSKQLLTNTIFHALKHLLTLAPTIDARGTAKVFVPEKMPAMVYEFDATEALYSHCVSNCNSEAASSGATSTISAAVEGISNRTEKLSVLIIAKDEAEVQTMQSFENARVVDYDWSSEVRVVDDIGIGAAISKYFIGFARTEAIRNMRQKLASFEASESKRSIGERVGDLILAPEYMAMVSLESHNTLLTAKAAIVLASALEYMVCKLIQSGAKKAATSLISTANLSYGIDRFVMAHDSRNVVVYPLDKLPGLVAVQHNTFYEDAIATGLPMKKRKLGNMLNAEAKSKLPSLDSLALHCYSKKTFNNSKFLFSRSSATLTDRWLWTNRDCVDFVIDEYFAEHSIARSDFIFTNEALNLLHTVAECHLLALLTLTKQRNAGIIVPEDIDKAAADLSLWWACCYQSDACSVRSLLESGANVNCNYLNFTPLILAICAGRIEVVHLLVEAGALNHYQDDTPLLAALQQGHANIADYLLSKREAYNWNKLLPSWFNAVECGDTDLLEIFFEHGIDVNTALDGSTALHLVCSEPIPDMRMAQFLICNGANIDLPNNQNMKAFDLLKNATSREKFLDAIEKRDFILK